MKSFEDLPKRVQEVSLEIMAQSKNKTELVRNLDNSECLRIELGAKHGDLRKEVDAIMRYAVRNGNA